MKTTIHSIVWDIHNGSHEVCLYTTTEQRDAALKAFMEERLNDIGDAASYYGADCTETIAQFNECRALLEAGKVGEAWDLFDDYENQLKHSDDYIYMEEHELEIPVLDPVAAARISRLPGQS